jgi:hypothetical protein
MDTQFQTPTKQRLNIPRNPTKPTRTSQRKKFSKKSLRISWRCYYTRSTKMYRRHSRNSKTIKRKQYEKT